MDKSEWYEDLSDYALRVKAMADDELDEEIKMLNRRITEIGAIEQQREINRRLLSEKTVTVTNDYGEIEPIVLGESDVHQD